METLTCQACCAAQSGNEVTKPIPRDSPGRLANFPFPTPHHAALCLSLGWAGYAAYAVCVACAACAVYVACAACAVYVVCVACEAYASGRYTCVLLSWQYSGWVDKMG